MFFAFSLKNLKEENRKKVELKDSYKKFFETTKEGFVTIFTSKKLIWFILYSAVISFLLVCLLRTYQLHFIALNIPTEYFGWIYFVLYVVSSISSKFSYKFKTKNIYTTFIILLVFLLFTPLLMSVHNILLLFVILIPRIVIGVYPSIIKEYINKEIKADRATIFSIRSLLSKMLQVFMLPLVGKMIDKCGLNVSLIAIAGFILISSICLMFGIKIIRKDQI